LHGRRAWQTSGGLLVACASDVVQRAMEIFAAREFERAAIVKPTCQTSLLIGFPYGGNLDRPLPRGSAQRQALAPSSSYG
jgi:hypothetical protein